MADHIPECFCDEESMNSCDWVVETTVKYYRDGDTPGVSSTVVWKLDEIPQSLAQLILQTFVKSMNEQGWEVYSEWMKACIGDSAGISQMVEKIGKRVSLSK